jgi:hypothetical protein
VVGYGVASSLYTSVYSLPPEEGSTVSSSPSIAYLRRGLIVEVLERRVISNSSWLLVKMEDGLEGWMPESAIRVYDKLSQARTAADASTTEASK